MRRTMKEIEVNVAYRWFLGLDMLDPIPHFSTFGKNYTRRFKDTDLFEQIFSKILEDCMKYNLVNTGQIYQLRKETIERIFGTAKKIEFLITSVMFSQTHIPIFLAGT